MDIEDIRQLANFVLPPEQQFHPVCDVSDEAPPISEYEQKLARKLALFKKIKEEEST